MRRHRSRSSVVTPVVGGATAGAAAAMVAGVTAFCAGLAVVVALGASPAAAQGEPGPVATAPPLVAPQQPATTTTLPVEEILPTSTVIDNRELGNIITKPNSGKAPESAGDPGGWLQVSLFFLICGVVVLMGVVVWRRSVALRARRESAGLDPVAVARSRGTGTRQPSTRPPTPVD